MKKYFVFVILLLVSTSIYGKKVKFAVDMSDQTVNTTGVHIAGDFQTLAGFPNGDWMSNTTPLTNEPGTNIYSIVVDLPAMAKYEYKFLNGDQWYDVEFVPLESRIGYEMNDSRWLFVDSLSDDTTFAGAIIFSGNAPMGKNLVRFLVDMREQSSINVAGVHIAGDFQDWNPIKTRLYSFDGNLYEIIAYLESGTFEYKFINGNDLSNTETVPSSCAVNNNRSIDVSTDIVTDTICFSKCEACGGVEVKEVKGENRLNIYPNPSDNYFIVEFNDNCKLHNLVISALNGQILRNYDNILENSIRIEREDLSAGVYFISIKNNINKSISKYKIILK